MHMDYRNPPIADGIAAVVGDVLKQALEADPHDCPHCVALRVLKGLEDEAFKHFKTARELARLAHQAAAFGDETRELVELAQTWMLACATLSGMVVGYEINEETSQIRDDRVRELVGAAVSEAFGASGRNPFASDTEPYEA